ncbi:MAG TPA: peptidase S10 [Thermoanaerobaculia bacterium]|jgi:carboxypeptidase C (cathepsin A)|nr:peptidase S10 [Thermoanaerobaculia bacterium]
MSLSRPLLAFALLLSMPFLGAVAQPAQKPMAEKPKADAPEPPPPVEKKSVTQHSIQLGGQKLAYTATAGTLVIRDDAGKAKASIFSVSYVKDGVSDPATRPVTFCFNGGPGAASLWVHLGAFGPRRIETDDSGLTYATPARLVDNEYSILDVTDLVFIDPVTTGWSRPAPGEDPKQFHGLNEDIESVGEFIRLWLARNQRWASPKIVAGESYGTARAAGLAYYLLDQYGIQLNGVVLLSTVLNWQNQEFAPGNDIPYMIHVPSYTAAAWYHGRLAPDLQKDLHAALAEAEIFALGDYASALLQGDRLSPDRRREIAAHLARLTGLSVEFVERANLRIELQRFLKELLRSEGKTVGRIDARFTGRDFDTAGEEPEFDPSIVGLDGPYAGAINDYLRRDLGYQEDAVYERLTGKVQPWNWGRGNEYANVAERLRQAITMNPGLHVMIASGYYDFATPYFDARYTVAHMGLPSELRDHVKIETYEAGHMMYIKRTEHKKLHEDLVRFYSAAIRGR